MRPCHQTIPGARSNVRSTILFVSPARRVTKDTVRLEGASSFLNVSANIKFLSIYFMSSFDSLQLPFLIEDSTVFWIHPSIHHTRICTKQNKNPPNGSYHQLSDLITTTLEWEVYHQRICNISQIIQKQQNDALFCGDFLGLPVAAGATLAGSTHTRTYSYRHTL